MYQLSTRRAVIIHHKHGLKNSNNTKEIEKRRSRDGERKMGGQGKRTKNQDIKYMYLLPKMNGNVTY